MSVKITRIIENVELGEGPHWDEKTQSLYFVDIFGKCIHKYHPPSNKHTKAHIDLDLVSLIVPVEGRKDEYVVSIGRELAVVTWDGESGQVANIKHLLTVDDDPATFDNRFNDGKCDATGRLWAGTMGGEPVNGAVKPFKGAFYSFALSNSNQVKTHMTNVGISNGLAWSLDNTLFYYIDSHKGTVDCYDCDLSNATISNCRTIFTLSKHDIPGAPDGMAIDTDGNLWVAIFNGYRVIRIDPRNPETLLNTIKLPAKQVTSVAFGGRNLDELYVTSAAFTVNGDELPPPDHGAVYRILGTGAKGFAGVRVKL